MIGNKTAFILCVILVVIFKLTSSETDKENENVIVSVEQGPIKGTILKSAKGKNYYAFQGIPYAEPPVGFNRFKEPLPLKSWLGIWNGEELGNACLQYTHMPDPDSDAVNGDEDCLFINVYTPKLVSKIEDPLLDVIVYIHGGDFLFGASHIYGPKYIMDRDVVFVNFNYRLGILGFLSTEDYIVPGNNGLKDQTLALKWIKSNIKVFGGNPNSITITGLSAGGASVHFHYLSQLSRGLFHRGISFSGTALCSWVITEKARDKAQKLGSLVGCNTTSSEHLVQCLRQRPAKYLVSQTKHFQPWLYNPVTPFGPTIELPSPTAFISEYPVQTINEGGAQDLPWLTTITSEEGLYPGAQYIDDDKYLHDLNERFLDIAPHLLDYNDTVMSSLVISEVGNRIREFYFGRKNIGRDTTEALIKMIGDRLFTGPAEDAALLQAVKNEANVYFYKFSYRGAHSFSEVFALNNKNYGSCHVDDVTYLFNSPYCITDETANDRKMTDLLLDVLISFAKTGTPEVPRKFGITWPPVKPNSGELTFLHIISPQELQVETSKNLGNSEFWKSLPIRDDGKKERVNDEL